MRKQTTAPTFSIPRFVAPSVSNSALEVVSIDAVAGTFTAKVYDPLDVSDLAHGDVVTFPLDSAVIPVELAPVLFRSVA